MSLSILPLFALLQVGAQPPGAAAPTLQPSPIARVIVTPANPVVTAQDTIRLKAEAVDAQGKPVPDVQLRFVAAGGSFEGTVEPDGLVHSGSTGTIPVSVVGLYPGAAPVIQRVEVRMVPGPVARVAIDAGDVKLVVGQRFTARATSYSAVGDRRDDRMTWKSSAPNIVRVSETGLVTAVAPGRATITAGAGSVSGTMRGDVVANNISSLTLTPGTAERRTGDVIRFTATPKTAGGATVAGLNPTWTFAPGHGVIDQDGSFVGYEAGTYTVTATIGTRSADAVVTLTPRDVRRRAQVVGRLPRTQFSTEEVWLHPTQPIAYLGTGGGGDRMYTIDISDPSKPVVTDSLVVNTRRVNDIMTTPDGKFMVFTREGASDRRNGIVIASLEDPRHPKKISEFNVGVTARVHSSFVY